MPESNSKAAKLTRRTALQLMGTTSLAALLPNGAQARPLSIPTVQESVTPNAVPFSQPPSESSDGGHLSTSLTVTLREEFLDGQTRRYRTYDGLFTGPTLRIKPADTMAIALRNTLPPEPHAHTGSMNEPHGMNTTNLHTHGLWVSPQSPADDVLLSIPPGGGFDHYYEIPDTHVCGTFWYHPHKHGSVEPQVSQGMSGAIIIEGGIDELDIIRDATERVMVIQQIKPEETNRILKSQADIAGAPNKTTTINALHGPTLQANYGDIERWRFIAANYHDFLHIQLRDMATGRPVDLHPIAFDGIPVRTVRPTDTIDLAPGNRVDVLVPQVGPGMYEIYKVGDHSQFDADKEDETIGFYEVLPSEEPVVIRELPEGFDARFSHDNVTDTEVEKTETRNIVYSMEDRGEGKLPGFLINGKEFEEGRVDVEMTVGTAEEWVITNESDFMHPFHIHVNPFEVIEISDDSIEPNRWLDTVPLPPKGHVVIRMRLREFTGDFVQHCHILLHEDHGMMQLIRISE
ncbi:multicopper oxidase family protein [uncultured Litoreibacter sp.]|uniref:multicopper oxidase family protein n=1 Tax=uncultured Litoreibacter sp. TaxID=1392394 RepID=UPI00262C4E07|nr:multicopper oxidase family protein [uncultured Litoreibacter sp.]